MPQKQKIFTTIISVFILTTLAAPTAMATTIGTDINSSGTLTVAGTTALTGAATLSSTLAVNGATTLTGVLYANGGFDRSIAAALAIGATNATALNITPATTITGALTANGAVTLGDAAADIVTVTGTLAGASPLVFEGLTANDFETTFAITDSTADRTIIFPDADGTVMVGATSTTTTQALFATATAGAPAYRAIADADVPNTITIDLATTAATATNTAITEDVATATAVYPTWVTANTGNLPQKTTSTRLSFVPSTGILTATGFAGALTGNVIGNVTGNVSGTAATVTGAAQAAITSVGTLTGLTMGGTLDMGANNITGTGSLGVTGSRLLKGWFTDLEVTNAIAGSVTGNAITATTAATATNTAITEDVATATAVYPTWVTANTGNLPQKTTSTRLSFVPSTGILTATGFAGALTGTASLATALAANPTDCTNQFANAIIASGNLTCASVTNDYLSAGTFGSITGTGTLTAGATGAGFTVALGTSTVTGILGAANGGTANGFFAVTGPTTATKTFTLPDASATILTTNVVVTAAQGGTGQTSYAVGDLLYASTTTAFSKLADVATGNALISGGADTAPAWGKIGLTTHVSGTLAVGNGGTGLTAGTSGGVPYFSADTTLASSAALTVNQLVIGGGAGAAPAALGSLGTTTTVLHGNAGGAPTFGAVSLTADVSGVLPDANVANDLIISGGTVDGSVIGGTTAAAATVTTLTAKGATNYALAATADNLAYTLTVPITALTDGAFVIFKMPNANSGGASTLNVNSLGAKKMLKGSDNVTQIGNADLVANGSYMAVYNTSIDGAAGAWVVLNK